MENHFHVFPVQETASFIAHFFPNVPNHSSSWRSFLIADKKRERGKNPSTEIYFTLSVNTSPFLSIFAARVSEVIVFVLFFWARKTRVEGRAVCSEKSSSSYLYRHAMVHLCKLLLLLIDMLLLLLLLYSIRLPFLGHRIRLPPQINWLLRFQHLTRRGLFGGQYNT